MKIALASLITDGAVERVVGKQELHDSSSSNSCWFRSRVNAHSRSNLRAARSNGLWSFLDFDQTHPTISSNFESFVVAKARNFNTILLSSLENGEIVINLNQSSGIPCTNPH